MVDIDMKYIALTIVAIIFPYFALAQAVQFGDQGLAIDLEPAFPQPGQAFTATANDYSLPIQGTTIRWSINGELRNEYLNERVIPGTAPLLGKEMTIKLEVSLPTGGSVSIERTIAPVNLDIILEPQTRTPAFFKGRGLPSIGSKINATAIVNGNKVLPSSLIYTWRLNSTVLESGSIQGRNNISFSMPQGRRATLVLDVRELNGEPLAQRIIDVPSVTPSISFYEISTLYGFKQKAVGTAVPLLGDSITLRAEPYNLDLATYNEPDHLEWKIAGVRTQSSAGNPYEITLAATGGSGRVPVSFHVRNTVQLLQGSQGSFDITY